MVVNDEEIIRKHNQKGLGEAGDLNFYQSGKRGVQDF